MQTSIIQLMNLFQPFHEAGKVLRMGPLIVGSPYGHVDVNGCHEKCRHVPRLFCKSMVTCNGCLLVPYSFMGQGLLTAHNARRYIGSLSPQSTLPGQTFSSPGWFRRHAGSLVSRHSALPHTDQLPSVTLPPSSYGFPSVYLHLA